MTASCCQMRMAVAVAIVLVSASAGRVVSGSSRTLEVRLKADTTEAAENALSLRATITRLPAEASAKAGAATAGALTISLSRWSSDAERAPLIAAFAAPPPPPPRPAAPAGPAGAAGRGRGRGEPPPPPSPLARLSTAIKAAPTLGFIWTDGVTGYSIKYAWRSPATEDTERVVLVTDRRLNSHAADWTAASSSAGDADFTLIEMQLDAH